MPNYFRFSATLLAADQSVKLEKNSGFAGFAPGGSSDKSTNRNFASDYAKQVIPLKYNQAEVESIEKIYGGEIFTGNTATEASFREHAPGKKILHLAMHALVNDSIPSHSGLLFEYESLMQSEKTREVSVDSLGFPTKDDGILMASEIYGLNLQADLVVLSACNTGLGRHQKGEGIMSLGRAFAYAGCPNIVMSLWQADDYATSELMKMYYRYLKEGFDKGQSLQKARAEYLATQDQLHPYFWGSFILIGDPTPIKDSSNRVSWGILLGLLMLFGLFYMIRSKKN